MMASVLLPPPLVSNHPYLHSSLSDEVTDDAPCRAYQGTCPSCTTLRERRKALLLGSGGRMFRVVRHAHWRSLPLGQCAAYSCAAHCSGHESSSPKPRPAVRSQLSIEAAERQPCTCQNALERCSYGHRYWCGECGHGVGGMYSHCNNAACTLYLKSMADIVMSSLPAFPAFPETEVQ